MNDSDYMKHLERVARGPIYTPPPLAELPRQAVGWPGVVMIVAAILVPWALVWWLVVRTLPAWLP